jgi:membrane protease YdiL (CAAX protease family)
MLSEKPWRSEAVFLFCAAQAFCLFAGVTIITALRKIGVTGFIKPEDFGNVLIATLSFQGATWILMPIFLRYHGLRWRDALGFRKKNWWLALLLAAVVVILILPVAAKLEQLSVFILEKKLHWKLHEEEAVMIVSGAKMLWTKIYLDLFAVALAPVAEEFIFRGVLFPYLKQRGFPKLAWLGVSFVFALIHGDAAVFASLFLLALALTWLYEKTDNLLAPIFAHALFNTANLVMLSFASK